MSEGDEMEDSGTVRSLALVRAAIVAHTVEATLRCGFLQALKEHGRVPDACRAANVKPAAAQAIVDFLNAEGVLRTFESGDVEFSEEGHAYLRNPGCFRLLIAGYAPLWNGLAELLAGAECGELRDLESVAVGSGLLAPMDALPLIRGLWPRERPVRRLLDVGFGDGSMMVTLAEEYRLVGALGVEPASELVRLAEHRFGDRNGVEFRRGNALATSQLEFEPDVILFAFVLQEVVGQTSVSRLVEELASVARRWPEADVIVIEVMRPSGDAIQATPFGRDYYGPYTLIHTLTKQELLYHEDWCQVFRDAGYELVEELIHQSPDDETGLERGYRLRRR